MKKKKQKEKKEDLFEQSMKCLAIFAAVYAIPKFLGK